MAQLVTNGSAVMVDNCCQITPDNPGQAGSVFNTASVNLNQSFFLDVVLNFGCKDNNGADGIVFVLAQSTTALGGGGGFIGYQGINNSIAVEIDDYQNGNYGDPSQDHLAIISNGSVNHNQNTNLSGPSTISNIEDCLDHCFSIEWDPNIPVFRARLDNNLIEYYGDIRAFVGPSAFFGFTSATGGLSNIHKVCFNQTPDFTPMPDVSICQGDSVLLQADPNGSAWSWNPNPTLSNTEISNPMASPTSTTTYTVTITYGCSEVVDDVRVTVLPNPDINITSNQPVCEGEYLSIYAEGGTLYQWSGPGQFSSTLNLIEFDPAVMENSGVYTLRVSGANGCSIDTSIFVEVFPLTPAEILDTLDILCYSTPGIYIGAYPPGGVWSGNISNDGFVDPVILGSGVQHIIYEYTNAFGCISSASDSFFIPELPRMTITGADPLCAAITDTAFVEITILGDGPFNVLFQQGISFFDKTTDLSGNLLLPITSPGIYNIYEIEDVNGCRYMLQDSFTITSFNPPDFKNVNIECSPDITYYSVTFQIEADSNTFFEIDGMGGILKQLDPYSFLIDSISNGSAFAYNLTNIYTCGEKQLMDSVTCVCTTDAGTLPPDSLKICAGGQIISTFLGGEILTKEDTILFVLHDGSLDSLGKILAVSAAPTFNSDGLILNSVYIIHAVAGKKSFFNTGSFSFPCIDLSNGQPVIILPNVKLEITTDIEDMCPGEEVKIGIEVLGTEKFSFHLYGGNINEIIDTNQSPYIYTIVPSESTIFYAKLLTDQNNLLCAVNIKDSIIVNLLPVFTTEKTVQICMGDSIKIAGKYEKNQGRFEEKLTTIYGCDSTIFYNLIELKKDTTFKFKSTCKENESGIFTESLKNIWGCDSLIVTNVNFVPIEILVKEIKTCSYSLPDTTILSNQLGCDSLIVTKYIFSPPDTMSIFLNACQSFYWEDNNKLYTNSGIYEIRLKNQLGCDSLVRLHLTILPHQFVQKYVSACDSFYIGPNKGFQYVSGEIIDSSTNILGCDSIHLTKVNIFPSYHFQQNVLACNSYDWIPGQQNLTESGIYKFALVSSNGCDSIYTINLTIEKQVEIFDTIISESPYTWGKNGNTYEESGVYTDEVTSVNGCDTIFVLFYFREFSGDVYIGNIVKPASTGKNQTIYISASASISQIESFSIFDRWGNKVFNRVLFMPNIQEEGWDGTFNGKFVASGVYSYLVVWRDSNNKFKMKTGDITVIYDD